MATPEKRRGFVGNVYRNTDTPGEDGTPQTWSQIESAGDIKIGDSWSTFEASNRASPVKKYLNGQQEWAVEFKIIVDRTDEDFIALQAAYRAGDPIALFAADGDSETSETSGPYADWLVTEFGKEMPLAGGQEITVKLMPHANCRFEPQYLEIV